MVQANPNFKDDEDSKHEESGPEDDASSRNAVSKGLPSSLDNSSDSSTDAHLYERIIAGLEPYVKPDCPVHYFTKFYGTTPIVFAVTN